jgi:predicted nucleotidyltransferase
MHFYESSVITTTDGLHCQVYGNEHPDDKILVKPKYIPTDKISSDSLPYRFISGRKMNRLDLWTDKDKLKQYIDAFTKAYPEYIFKSPMHEKSPLFFVIPKKNI